MKGFAQADWAEHKEKFQQKFIPCPEWAEAESIFAGVLDFNKDLTD